MRVVGLALFGFVLWAAAEISILVLVADQTNILIALLLMVVTGLAGVVLARAQGWHLMTRIRQEFGRGEVPVDSLLSGLVLFIAGILLLIPGFLSDVAGILLLLPPIRNFVARRMRRWFEQKIRVGKAWIGPIGRSGYSQDGDVVDSYTVPSETGSSEQRRLTDDPRAGQ